MARRLHFRDLVPLIADPLAQTVIGCAIEVHRALGPGLLESAYKRCLSYEFIVRGIGAAEEVAVPLRYKEIDLQCGYRVDFVIERRLIIELKAVDHLLPIHQAQVLTYLRLLHVKQGLLINFNVPRLGDGIKSLLL